MATATKTETPQEKLNRIQSMPMGKNDVLVIQEFYDRGVDPEDITPRVNVLPFHAWKALDRKVAKGATSVPVTVWVPCDEKDAKPDPKTGEKKKSMRPKTSRLFHISQTIAKDEKFPVKPAAWNNPALIKAGTYEPNEPAEGNEDDTETIEEEREERTTINGKPVFLSYGGPHWDEETKTIKPDPEDEPLTPEEVTQQSPLDDRTKEVFDELVKTGDEFGVDMRDALNVLQSDARDVQRFSGSSMSTPEGEFEDDDEFEDDYDCEDDDEFAALAKKIGGEVVNTQPKVDRNGRITVEKEPGCNCPMAGVVTNVDCPIHGGR